MLSLALALGVLHLALCPPLVPAFIFKASGDGFQRPPFPNLFPAETLFSRETLAVTTFLLRRLARGLRFLCYCGVFLPWLTIVYGPRAFPVFSNSLVVLFTLVLFISAAAFPIPQRSANSTIQAPSDRSGAFPSRKLPCFADLSFSSCDWSCSSPAASPLLPLTTAHTKVAVLSPFPVRFEFSWSPLWVFGGYVHLFLLLSK